MSPTVCARFGWRLIRTSELNNLELQGELQRRFRQADQVRQQLIGTVGAGGQLAPQAESDIDPASFADRPFDERPELFPRIIRKRIDHRYKVDVLGIFLP